jgi:hypothetical protein
MPKSSNFELSREGAAMFKYAGLTNRTGRKNFVSGGLLGKRGAGFET